MSQHNENCLAGLRCPKCQSHGGFNIACTAFVDAYDEGTGTVTEIDWNPNAACRCLTCHHTATVHAFTKLSDEEEQSLLNAVVAQCLYDEQYLRELLLERVVRSEGRPFAEDFWDNFDPADFTVKS